MPTSNTPMTAQALLALADDLLDHVESGAFDSCCLDTDYIESGLAAIKAYRAARAASPRTLEEALMIELAKLNEPHPSGVPMSPEYVESRADDIIAAIREHARRLAGKGGA